MTCQPKPTIRPIEHFSSWDGKPTAWLLQLKNLLFHLSRERKEWAKFSITPSQQQPNLIKLKFRAKNPSVEDLRQAEEALVCSIQQQHFEDEIASLKICML